MRNMKTLTIILILLTTANLILAGDFQVTAQVDKNIIPIGGYIRYTLEMSGPVTSIPSPSIPGFEADFHILSGPNESTSIQYINGKLSASKTISYTLQPKKEGEITIPPASVIFKKKLYQTQPITITVKSSHTPPPIGGQQGQQGESEKPSQATPDIFLRAEPQKTSLVQNEGTIVYYRLYFRPNISSYEITQFPQTPGFWVEEFDMPSQPVIGTEIVNGMRYQTATLRKIALFPTKSGKMTVAPLEIRCDVQERRKSNFSDPFGRLFDDPFITNIITVPRYVQSQPLELNVLPFPAKGKPADFTGAVGQYTMEVSINKDSLKTNEALTLTVKINGRGNIKMLLPPKVSFPADFEVYDPEIDIQTSKATGVVSGSKTFKYLLVPRFPGEQTIKPIEYSFYDPLKKRYQILKSDGYTVQVQRSAEMVMPGGVSISPSEITLYGQDIRFIKTTANLKSIDSALHRKPIYYLAYICPLLLFIGSGLLKSYIMKLNPDEIRAKNAFRKARSALNQAGKLKKTDKPELFFRQISDALRGYIADKAGLSSAGIILEEIKAELQTKGVSEKTLIVMTRVLQDCDMGRFSPAMPGTSEREKLILRAQAVLKKMEEQWRN